MKNIKFYFTLSLMICSFSNLLGQLAEDAPKSNVLELKEDGYQIVLSQYGDGKQNLSWEEGEKLFGMGGSLKAILEKLLSDYEWNVDNKWMGNNYYLRINYNSQTLSKGEINQIFIEQLPSAIGANIEKSKVKKEALCLSLESSNMSLKEAVDRVAMNKIMRQGNDLKIHSVKLTDLAGLVTLNSSYILRMENLPLESNRFDFNLNIRSKAQLIRDLETYGFIVEECFVEKELVKLLDLAK